MSLSVVLAVRNEEKNIERCLLSVKSIADEIIVIDEYSTDKTREIAKKLGAKVFLETHHEVFHITKEMALKKAKGDWILQLDADEVLTPELSNEIEKVIKMSNQEIIERISPDSSEMSHFLKHQRLIEKRDGKIGDSEGNVSAFFIPRVNVFLGKEMRYGGTYPDGVIRLVRKGAARFPQKSVHEQMEVKGRVLWLFNPIKHYDSPTLNRYLFRLNRYTTLQANDLRTKKVPKSLWEFFMFTFLKPSYTFLNIYFRHKGFLDGVQGFIWAFFSAMHFPIAYFKYVTSK